jgi:hypothetical protein
MRDEARACTQRAYLYLARDIDAAGPPYADSDAERMAFDPDEITALVGLRPTEAWRRGDPSPWTAERPRRFSGWKYELPEVATFDTEAVVTGLLDAIEPYATGIARACDTLGMTAGVTVVIWMRADSVGDLSTPSIGYRAETVQRLANLRLALDHDQYVELTR